MLHTLGPKNGLITLLSNYLSGDEGNTSNIVQKIKQAPPSVLIPTFSFLGRWITINMNNPKNETSQHKLNDAFQFLGVIANRVPPVLVHFSTHDMNWDIFDQQWVFNPFFKPIKERIAQLKSYVQPRNFIMQALPSRLELFENTFSFDGELLDLDPAYEVAIMKYMRRLIINHAPMSKFRIFSHQRNYREILTKSFLDVIDSLNDAKNATHEELIFAFSMIFLYINAFTSSNELDGQMFAKYLQSRPYISPFCMLGVVNHIPQTAYLFNLLTPQEVNSSLEQITNLNPQQYNMQDFSITNQGKNKILPFVKQLPNIVSNYFLCTPNQTNSEVDQKMDDADFLTFIHTSGHQIPIKMKQTLCIARARKVSVYVVSCMGILLLRCIIFSIQKTIIDCAETRMFTPDFCTFVQTVFSILSPAFASGICGKFLDPKEKEQEITILIARALYFHALHIAIQHDSVDNLRAFLFRALAIPSSEDTARLIIAKLLQSDSPKMSEKTMDLIINSADLLINLEFIDAITFCSDVGNCEEFEKLSEMKERLKQNIQIMPSIESKDELFCVEFFKSDKGLNEISAYFVGKLQSLTAATAIKEISKILDEAESEDRLYHALRLIMMTQFLKLNAVAEILVKYITKMLATFEKPADTSQFEIRKCEHGLLLGQCLLGRLLILRFNDLALQLMENMMNPLMQDKLALHWIARFTSLYREYITPDVAALFLQVLPSLPSANDLLVSGDDEQAIDIIVNNIVVRKELLLHSPDAINSEYWSQHDHAMSFSIATLCLSSRTSRELAEFIARPIFDAGKVLKFKEEIAITVAQLAGRMNFETSCAFFEFLMEHSPSASSVIAGRTFLATARIDVFAFVCQMCKDMISGDAAKLDAFMRMIVPSYLRLKGNDNIAARLLCKLLESVNEETPRALQEAVIDVVSLIYFKLNLQPARATFVSSAGHFSPDLKQFIAFSLATDMYSTKRDYK
ncbi:hypothetical protein TVAG_055290 [Trichomonas vaginalis G3]|uniref:Uncharacterized protein n=1 Tax=Trichomonas vaginalis (strain ATCC PRA-98 / G3) TaxID=412133 RepID=A2ETJ7_TRIV3|nr:hypothetical protein TVAGG3_0007690 [Trichomonas vaginalis G3]EAY04043.1 hypothetical protein TVAG_055290 [Trichomonas vaginalis G3]KAI5538993.1 hypothetical protein TVAGG3_0007690 [Trichomonas vaginalis G3]|eukprot:XP_001316266.1 hypothetical protein [Trichomonas vaginalis G3]